MPLVVTLVGLRLVALPRPPIGRPASRVEEALPTAVFELLNNISNFESADMYSPLFMLVRSNEGTTVDRVDLVAPPVLSPGTEATDGVVRDELLPFSSPRAVVPLTMFCMAVCCSTCCL